MHYVGTNIVFGQAFHLPAKFDERTQATIRRVVEVAGQKNEIRLCPDRMIHDAIQSLERRRMQQIAETRRRSGQTTKRAIQMQIGRMDEPERFHNISLTGKAGQDWSGILRVKNATLSD